VNSLWSVEKKGGGGGEGKEGRRSFFPPALLKKGGRKPGGRWLEKKESRERGKKASTGNPFSIFLFGESKGRGRKRRGEGGVTLATGRKRGRNRGTPIYSSISFRTECWREGKIKRGSRQKVPCCGVKKKGEKKGVGEKATSLHFTQEGGKKGRSGAFEQDKK